MQPMDLFFITYDEPLKDEFWKRMKERWPDAKRVDGVKGFNRAHQECARLSSTERFFTVDGDTVLNEKFSGLQLPADLLESQFVLSWSSKNHVNGLAYGNGGVKNWRRSLVLNLKTHEDCEGEDSSVDFCFTVDYFQMPDVLSTSFVNATPLQAFRAGFREGMKMALDRGKKIVVAEQHLAEAFHQKIHVSNMERLKIWCTVGSDIENGLWAIYGTRLGLYELYFKNTPLEFIRDYDWFNQFWQKTAAPFSVNDNTALVKAINDLGHELNQRLNMDLVLFTPEQSKFFKSVYFNRPRQGLMFA